MKKKRLALTVLFISHFSIFTLSAQSAFPTLGGDVSGNGGSLSYTVGQLAISFEKQRTTNAEVIKTSLFEGVQQTYCIDELDIDGVLPINLNVNIYPNPTTDCIQVMPTESIDNLKFELYTIDGQLLQHGIIRGIKQTIDMKNYPSGSYLLRVHVDNMENNYRIIKIH